MIPVQASNEWDHNRAGNVARRCGDDGQVSCCKREECLVQIVATAR